MWILPLFYLKEVKKWLRINLARYYDSKTGLYSTSQINYDKEAYFIPPKVTILKEGTIYNKNRSAKIAIHVVPLNSSHKTNHIDYDPTIDVKHPPSKLAYAGLVLLNLFRVALVWLIIWFATILLLNPKTSQFNWYFDLIAVFGALLLINVFTWVIDRFHLISVVKNNHEIQHQLSNLKWKPTFILAMINSIMVVTGGVLLLLSLQQIEKEQSDLVLLSGFIGFLLAILIIYILWLRNTPRVATIEHSQILDTLRLTKEYTIRECWGWTTISTFTRIAIVGIISYLNIGLVESSIFSISQVDLWLSVGILVGLAVLLHYAERQVNRRLICYFLNYCHKLPKPPSLLLDAYRSEGEYQTTSPHMNTMNMSAKNQDHNQMPNHAPQPHQPQHPQQYQQQPINKLNNQPVAQDYANELGIRKIPVSIIQCPVCHSEVKSIYNFCFECGSKLDER
jgi:hypothetical protein